MVSLWSLSGSKLSQVSTTLLSILTDLYNAVVPIVFTRPLISKSFWPFIHPLVTVPRAPIAIGITVTFMFHSFFNSSKTQVLIFLFAFFVSPFGQPERQHSLFGKFSFLLTITWSDRLVEIKWSVCISKSQRILFISLSRTCSGLSIYHLFVWPNLNFLHISQSCLYSFCTNLLQSLIIWLIVSSLSPHNLHLLFCGVLPIFALTKLVFMVLFCVAIR